MNASIFQQPCYSCLPSSQVHAVLPPPFAFFEHIFWHLQQIMVYYCPLINLCKTSPHAFSLVHQRCDHHIHARYSLPFVFKLLTFNLARFETFARFAFFSHCIFTFPLRHLLCPACCLPDPHTDKQAHHMNRYTTNVCNYLLPTKTRIFCNFKFWQYLTFHAKSRKSIATFHAKL